MMRSCGLSRAVYTCGYGCCSRCSHDHAGVVRMGRAAEQDTQVAHCTTDDSMMASALPPVCRQPAGSNRTPAPMGTPPIRQTSSERSQAPTPPTKQCLPPSLTGSTIYLQGASEQQQQAAPGSWRGSPTATARSRPTARGRGGRPPGRASAHKRRGGAREQQKGEAPSWAGSKCRMEDEFIVAPTNQSAGCMPHVRSGTAAPLPPHTSNTEEHASPHT